MRWPDPLYGPWELPEAVARLVVTDRAVRMHDISQSVLPLKFEPYGRMPSRFEHGMGVARLAEEMLKFQGPNLPERYFALLPVAAFLHDCGNPPFSHLTEPFLKADLLHDGESFLTAMLRGSETAEVLEELGLGVEAVTALVTGNDKPVAEVLAGSLDLDNADNVARYWMSGRGPDPRTAGYNPIAIAQAYRFDPTDGDGTWGLLAGCEDQARAWKVCRELIYGLIYSNPHWGAAAMVQRALYLHWLAHGRLTEQFYFMTDKEATIELLSSDVPGVRELMVKAARHEWFVSVAEHKLEEPNIPQRLRDFCKDPMARHTLANTIANETGIPQQSICVAAGRGRDRRKVTLPFIRPSGERVSTDKGPSQPPWRVFAWVDAKYTAYIPAIASIIKEHTAVS